MAGNPKVSYDGDATLPGTQSKMHPKPWATRPDYRASGKLEGLTALVTGGDSGIGRSAAVLFAKEGADVAISYLEENDDAREVKELIEAEGRRCLLIPGDLAEPAHCKQVIAKVKDTFGRLDVLVNNAAEQHARESITDISDEQLERTFQTNFFAGFRLCREAMPLLEKSPQASIIMTTSVVAYEGNVQLLDYTATKGALTAFMRGLSQLVIEKNVRVNAVAPGPIWTPLITGSFPEEKWQSFGEDTPVGRFGWPDEVGEAYVFLASKGASYITGQTIHVNGGRTVAG